MNDYHPTGRPFTGQRMLLVMFGFFGTVIAVNMIMFGLASSSFGGLVVGNSYIASQRFNAVREAARAQPILTWRISPAEGAPLALRVEDARGPVAGLALTASAYRPTKGRAALALGFSEDGGLYRADRTLDPGLWALDLSAADGQRRTVRIVIPEDAR